MFLILLSIISYVVAWEYPADPQVTRSGIIRTSQAVELQRSDTHVCMLTDARQVLGYLEWCQSRRRVATSRYELNVYSNQDRFRCGSTCFPVEVRNPRVTWFEADPVTQGSKTIASTQDNFCWLAGIQNIGGANHCFLQAESNSWTLSWRMPTTSNQRLCQVECMRATNYQLTVRPRAVTSSGTVTLANGENVCALGGVARSQANSNFCTVRRARNGNWEAVSSIVSGAICYYTCATGLPIPMYSDMVFTWDVVAQLSGTIRSTFTVGMETGDERSVSVSQGSSFTSSVDVSAKFFGAGVSTSLSAESRRDLSRTVSAWSSRSVTRSIEHECRPVFPNGTAAFYATLFKLRSTGTRSSFVGTRNVVDEVSVDEFFCRRSFDTSRTPPACPPGRCGDGRVDPNCENRNLCLSGTWR